MARSVRPRSVPPGWRLLVALAVVALAAGTLATPLPQFIAAAVERMLEGRLTLTRTWRIVIFGHGATVLLLAITLGMQGWMWRLSAPTAMRRIGLGEARSRQLRMAVVASAPLLAVLALAVWLPALQLRLSPSFWYLLPQIVVDTAIREEFVFRGFLFRNLRARWSRRTAVIVSAVAFSVMHLPAIWRTTGHFALGMAWWPIAGTLSFAAIWGAGAALLAEQGGGSIWGPVLAHTIVDAHQLLTSPSPGSPLWALWIIPAGQFASAFLLIALAGRGFRSRGRSGAVL